MKWFFVFIFCFTQVAHANPTREEIREKIKSFSIYNLETYAPEMNDRAEDFVEELKYKNLNEMDSAKLTSAKVSKIPWSDHYWPLYAGVIASRYADKNYASSFDWKENEKYLLDNLGRGEIRYMSPAEKYDLLIGDPSFTLTKKMVAEGSNYYGPGHEVETWMGICHGWAPASYMTARPNRLVWAKSADGTMEIPFYPSDIKALTSLLWANSRFYTKFIGGRCNEKDPERDENGRPKNIDCLDSNPGTWHLAIVNQIGVSGRSFILDTNFDYAVWNQPVIGYSYFYINPITGQETKNLSEAVVDRKDYKDPFEKSRAESATKIVRISLKVDYGMENYPEHYDVDLGDREAQGSSTYVYELELDNSGNIVGGEWKSRSHPDFLWTPTVNAKALSYGDQVLDYQNDRSVWDAGKTVPVSWRRVAEVSSSVGQPLARVVNRLIELAN